MMVLLVGYSLPFSVDIADGKSMRRNCKTRYENISPIDLVIPSTQLKLRRLHHL